MATLLYADNKPSAAEAFGVIMRLLDVAVMAHRHHLTTDSYAKHMALDELYKELPGLVDSLAEAFMGCTGQKFPSAGDAVAEVQGAYEFIETTRLKLGAESHIQNEVDNICNLLASTLYKLRNLA